MRFDKRKSKKAKSGYTWRVTFEYKDTYGHTQRYSKSGFPTKKAAEAHGLEVQTELEKGIDIKADKTLDDVFEEWLNITTLARNSIVNYSSRYKTHVQPVLGQMPVKDIHYPQLQKLFSDLEPRSKDTQNGIKCILKALGMLAIRSGYISDWPIEAVELRKIPTKPKEVPNYISYDQFIDLIDEIQEHQKVFIGGAIAVFLYIGYYSGLRKAEILGLEWDDIDLEKDLIYVRHQLAYMRLKTSEYYLTEKLKTESSFGSVPICPALHDVLEKWKEYNPYPKVICKRDGNYLSVAYFTNTIHKAGEAIGINAHPHTLRHTFITNLILAGTDPKTAAALARHSDPSITLKVYAEVLGTAKAEAIGKTFGISLDQEPKLQA